MLSSKQWQCRNCGLFNANSNPECQACFQSKPIVPFAKKLRITMKVLDGYFRNQENSSKTKIPQELRTIIMNYIEKKIIFAAGRNRYHQLGLDQDKYYDPYSNDHIQFVRLHDLESLVNNTKDIYNNDCALIIKSADNIFVAGGNSECQLGLEVKEIELDPDESDSNYRCFRCGRAGHWARNCPGDEWYTSIKTWTKIEEISKWNVDVISKGICNSYNTYFTTTDGKLYANGKNEYGCFGDMDKVKNVKLFEMNTSKWLSSDKITEISCGSKHVIFQTRKGNIYAMGNNEYGQCIKDTDTKNIIEPCLVDGNIKMVACGDWFSLLLTIDGVGKSAGDLQCMLYDKDMKIVKIAAGARHGLFLDDNCNVYSIGTDNECGQRGFSKSLNKQNAKNEPARIATDVIDIECGGDHSFLMSKNNELYSFGYNGYHQCGGSEENIWKPTCFMKEKELGFDYRVEKVICLHNETLIVINPFL